MTNPHYRKIGAILAIYIAVPLTVWGATYTTKRNDTLQSVASQNGITVDQLVALNPSILLATGQAINIPTATTTPPPATTTVQWGSFSGGTDATMATFEQQVGMKENLDAVFVGANDGPFSGSIAGSQGKTIVIFWEPSYSFSTLLSGKQDATITAFAQSLKAYGYPVIFVPFAEFNLGGKTDTADCTAWSVGCNGNSVSSFISSWQHLYTLFQSAGATNVKFALDYNDGSTGNATYASYYPGSQYVDIVGIDGFNFGGETYAQDIGNDIPVLQAFGKPIYILSAGSVSPQTAFIQALGAQQGIAGWVWFNYQQFIITSSSLGAFKGII